MRFMHILLVVAIFAVSFVMLPEQAVVQAEGCTTISGGDIYFDTFGPYSRPAGTTITFVLDTYAGNGTYVGVYAYGAWSDHYSVGPLTYTYTLPTTATDLHVSAAFQYYSASNAYTITICEPDDEAGPWAPLFTDDRLNADTPNAPVVFFPTAEGIDVYYNSGGLILRVDVAFLAANAGQNPLWQSGDMSFWLLDNGQYQFMVGPDSDGDVYVNTFDAMPPTTPKSTNISYNIYGNSPKW